MGFQVRGILAAGLIGWSGLAWADPVSQVLYSHKAWQVSGVAFDDGTMACLAEVSDPGESFSIWIYQGGGVRLQFYSEKWEFGEESDSANLQLAVDRRSPWTLTNAELYKNSVLFDLPDSDTGARFMVEVASGNVLHLRTESGDDVQNYSLSGSHASINAMFDCSDALPGSTSKNPFN